MGSPNAGLWAIVLAGGEGTRLAPLTRHIAGYDCPKQFCAVSGARTLLGQTLARVASLVPAERAVVIGNRTHAAYLRRELPGPVPHTLVQPANKGTAPGILWPIRWVAARDPDATVGVFPADHFVLQERAFLAYVARAVQIVQERPDLVVLLGMEPDGPDPGYGWIEPGEPVGGASGCAHVRGFWEKPRADLAARFLRAGFLWNSLIVVARARALGALGRTYLPDIDARLAELETRAGADDEAWALWHAYARMRSANFSREVLERGDRAVTVLPVRGVLWSDWGTPERVVRTLRRIGASPPWLPTWLARSA